MHQKTILKACFCYLIDNNIKLIQKPKQKVARIYFELLLFLSLIHLKDVPIILSFQFE
jgi:hypothetical protein